MALQLRNTTPFACQHLALMARNGASILRIVVKGAFDIDEGGGTHVCVEQPDVVMADEHWGEPGISSVRYESDVILGKPGTDLLIHGAACAPAGHSVTWMDVAVGYQGRLVKQLRVTGDREWRRGVMGWGLTAPKPFTRMPIVYERAFGGTDERGSEARNRAGAGYCSSPRNAPDTMPAPNIEFPGELISSIDDRPAPAGLGVISRHWLPRLGYAGTYDAAWEKDQFPLLPRDFDDRYFHSVHPDQWIDIPRGGEQIVVRGMTPEGLLGCILPPCDMPLRLRYRDGDRTVAMQPETVLLDTDLKRLTITWGASADIHGDPFRLLEIGLGMPATRVASCGHC